MPSILARIIRFTRSAFWRDASSLDDSATLLVMPGVLFFGMVSGAICFIEYVTDPTFSLGLEVTAFEVGGAVLGTMLVLRTNEGLNRWWEARKLWGGITNQCRSLAVAALAYGPNDPVWRWAVVRSAIVFAHACRRSLRGERDVPEIAALIGRAEANRLAKADHMPTYAALVLAENLRAAVDRQEMDHFAFLQADKERADLINHIGGCERILSTPLPRVYSIQIRRFIFLFLLLLPFGLIPKFISTAANTVSLRVWFVPLITMAVAYPLLALDRIGSELQNPFWIRNLGHLDLDGITGRIERNLRALIDGPDAIHELAPFAFDHDAQDPRSTSA
jgi:ion channel-forming bestrophin family protein